MLSYLASRNLGFWLSSLIDAAIFKISLLQQIFTYAIAIFFFPPTVPDFVASS